MLPIPTALLHTVAVPIHPTVDIRIFFKAEDGDHQFLERNIPIISEKKSISKRHDWRFT